MQSKFPLGFYPTPLERLNNLSKVYSNYTIYMKRDDQTGLATGGNKTRKLEYLIQDALNKNCDTIITAGAQQSNHCRQTAAACVKANLDCHLLLGGFEPESYNGNLFLSSKLNAKIHFTGDNRKGEDFYILFDKLSKKGLKPYIIPYGGSNFFGSLGYVDAIKELKEQLKQQKINIDAIFFASSSGGTQAGIHLGKLLYNLNAKLYPISVDKNDFIDASIYKKITSIVEEGIDKFKLNTTPLKEDYYLIEDYNKAGYGIVTKQEVEAINLLAKTEGILLDPVYTGRAFYGMMDMLQHHKIKKNSNILFWHTGGTPALFNHISELS
jgi:D-cysteine desulfhydrase